MIGKGLMPRLRATHLLLVSRLALGCVLVAAAVPKIQRPYQFLETVYAYQLTGSVIGKLVAVGLPWAEMVAGCCLVLGTALGAAIGLSLTLSLVFVVAQTSALVRGLSIDCGCFSAGTASNPIGLASMVKSAGVLLLATCALISWLRSVSSQPAGSGAPMQAAESPAVAQAPVNG